MQAMFAALKQCLKEVLKPSALPGFVDKIPYLRWRQLVKLKCRFMIEGEADLSGTHR